MKKIQLNMQRKNAYPCIEDIKYKEYMKKNVEPYLDEKKESGFYERTAGKYLYYENYMAEDAVGTVIVSHGFTECVQKYKEVIYYFLKENYHVLLIDHRGHGKSVRENSDNDFSLTHINSFMDYVEDFRGFIEEIVVPKAGTAVPFYIYAHSMGGAIACRYLQMYPGRVRKAILTAPMLGIQLGMPQLAARIVSYCMCKFGKSETYIMGQKAFCREPCFEESCGSDKERYEYYHEKRLVEQELQNTAGSYSWLYESIKATRIIEKEKRQIQIPLCIFSAEKDDLVTLEGQLNLAKKTPDSYLVQVSGTKHEIYMAPAQVQRQYWRYIFAFLQS